MALTQYSQSDFDRMMQQAALSDRKRVHECLHASPDDGAQRILIAMHKDSVVIPHKHVQSHQTETLMAISGSFTVLTFDDSFMLLTKTELSAASNAIVVLPPNTWHSMICNEESGVFFEIKNGPFDAKTAAEFPNQHPGEQGNLGQEFLAQMRELKVSQMLTGVS